MTRTASILKVLITGTVIVFFTLPLSGWTKAKLATVAVMVVAWRISESA